MDWTGQRIGQIRIEELIGTGGMGDVYRGFDEKLKRPVAVKTLRASAGLDTRGRARFLREARMLSRLNHPSICRVYDLVEHEGADLLMLELIEGRTLGELISAGVLGDEEKLAIARTVAEALAAAHRAGIVHRDMKPDNVMLTPSGEVKVLDFGLARKVDTRRAGRKKVRTEPGEPRPGSSKDAGTTVVERCQAPGAHLPPNADTLTEPEALAGTLAYMSPEQALKLPLTAASDMFSFGLLLQELLTGERAYPELATGPLILLVCRAETRPAEGLEPALHRLVEELLDPEPTRRPSASEVSRRLLEIAEEPVRKRQRRRRIVRAAAVAAMVVFALLAAWRSQIEARSEATAGQRFAQQVKDIEWLVRSAHLGPPEDLRPMRAEVDRRMAELAAEVASLGRLGRGPGEVALGRAALALGDVPAARLHLEEAWQAGFRSSEVAAALGLALVELHRREVAALAGSSTPQEEARRRADLDRELLEPAAGYLEIGRGQQGSYFASQAIDYATALIAFGEGRHGEALRLAEALAAEQPRFYEARLLVGRIYQALGESDLDRGAHAAADASFARAQEAYRAAASVGRSDPEALVALCDLEESRMVLEINGRGGDVEPVFERGIAACGTALEIDTDHAEALRLSAELHFRLAESRGDDPRPVLAQAAALAQAALERDPQDAATWKTLAHVHMVEADWEVYHGGDPREAIGRASRALDEAHRLAPTNPLILNSIGNARSLAAHAVTDRGGDPHPDVAAAVAAYERAIALDPAFDYPYANAAQALHALGLFELRGGQDPRPTTARGHGFLDRGLEVNPNDAQAHHVRASLWVLEADYEASRGGDPRPLASRAEEAARRSLEIYPEGIFAELSLASAKQVVADWELGRGGSPRAELTEARAAAERVLAFDPEMGEALVALGAALRAEAELAWRGGADPAPALERAAAVLERALAADPGSVEARLERERLAKLRSRLGTDVLADAA